MLCAHLSQSGLLAPNTLMPEDLLAEQIFQDGRHKNFHPTCPSYHVTLALWSVHQGDGARSPSP